MDFLTHKNSPPAEYKQDRYRTAFTKGYRAAMHRGYRAPYWEHFNSICRNSHDMNGFQGLRDGFLCGIIDRYNNKYGK